METKKASFLSLHGRWGFLFALVLLIGVLAVSAVLYAGKSFFREDLGLYVPTRSFAHQVASELMVNVGERVSTPSELFLWRSTGSWDEEPTFSKSTRFWFTYNSADGSYLMRPVNLPTQTSAAVLEEWKQKLTPFINAILERKHAGGIWEDVGDESGDFRLGGRIYGDEPKVVGMITDMDYFRQTELPQLLGQAKRNFPLLEVFTSFPEEGSGSSPMFILARNQQDSIIARLGEPGEYAYQEDIGALGFEKTYPYTDQLGFSLEVVIPRSIEKVWLRYITRGFYGLIIVWIITMILWARVEVRFRKTL